MRRILYSGWLLRRRSIMGRPCSNSPSDAAWKHRYFAFGSVFCLSMSKVSLSPRHILRILLFQRLAIATPRRYIYIMMLYTPASLLLLVLYSSFSAALAALPRWKGERVGVYGAVCYFSTSMAFLSLFSVSSLPRKAVMSNMPGPLPMPTRARRNAFITSPSL